MIRRKSNEEADCCCDAFDVPRVGPDCDGASGLQVSIDQAWKKVQAQQESQDKEFKRIERDAAKGVGAFRVDIEDAMPGSVTCPTADYRRIAP